MKKQKIIIGSMVILTLFAFITLANKYNLTVKKYSIIEDIEKTMAHKQEYFYRDGEPAKDGLDLLVKNIEKESVKNIKNNYNISLQDVKSEIVKEDGKTYIILEANLKNKLLIPKKISLKAKSEPQMFFNPNSKLRLIEK